MTGRELQKLRRQELLQLLLDQSKEAAGLQALHNQKDNELLLIEESNERLNAKLEAKNAVLDRLKERLENKDNRIQELEQEIGVWISKKEKDVEEADTIAEAALRHNDIFAVARQAADQYLYNIRQRQKKSKAAFSQQPDDMGGSEENGSEGNTECTGIDSPQHRDARSGTEKGTI